jgi:uncharacterized protein YukE
MVADQHLAVLLPRHRGGMPLLPDTSAMRATALRLINQANHLSDLAASVRGYSGQVRWRGAAALAFQDQAAGLCTALAATAHRLVAAAIALREHAANVDAALVEIRALAPDMIDPLGLVHHGGLLGGRPLADVVGGLESVASGAVHALEKVLPW